MGTGPAARASRTAADANLLAARAKLGEQWLTAYGQKDTDRRQVELPIVARADYSLPWLAPHFVDALLSGATTPTDGRIETTIDSDLQRLLETQFRNYFEKAAQQKGVTGENLLALLERRLDNVIYRLGFAMSRRQARQFVRHGHVSVNGRKVNIPSFQVKIGDEVSVRDKSANNVHIQGAFQTSGGRGRPGWLEIVNPDKLVGRVTAIPRREDVDQNINEQLIVELYSK